jgi:hypothetical protein
MGDGLQLVERAEWASSLISLGLRLLRAEERIYPHLHCPNSLINYKYWTNGSVSKVEYSDLINITE